MSELLEEIALVADIDNLEDSDNRVVLMTLHSAKRSGISIRIYLWYGRWIFPSYMTVMSEDDDDMEEERRLCYVGITRAKKKALFKVRQNERNDARKNSV